MAEVREIAEEYAELAHELIETMPELEHLKGAPIIIVYLRSSYEKKSKHRRIMGLTERVSSKNKWAIPADITITLYDTNIALENFTDEQIKILMFHELLHIGYEDEKLFIRPHDLEDFRLIVDKYGAYWDKSPEEKEDLEKLKLRRIDETNQQKSGELCQKYE